MQTKFSKRLLVAMLVLVAMLALIPAQALAAATGTHEPVAGVTVSVSGATDNSMTDGTVTVTAKGSAGVFGYGASAKTATITIYNDSENEAIVSFGWTANSVNSLVIDGATVSDTSGSFSKLMSAGDSVVITVTTAKNNTVNTFTMSSFAIVEPQSSYNVTINYDSTLGSVTADNAGVSVGSVVETTASGVALNATAASNAKFLGWINTADNKIISNNASFTYVPSADASIKAVFAGTSPWFMIDNTYLYEGLSAATAAVASASNKTIVLMNNATLPAGDYTIPAGVTLLIPFDTANTLYTTEPAAVEGYVTPTAFRTLTMASGANLIVNGSLSVSGKQCATIDYNGMPIGPLGFIQMAQDSTITINNGGFLYAWGYIIGSGSVTAKSGATVYEDFQLADYRGGTITSEIANDSTHSVFPMSQYYLQNIEVPLKLEAGATEYAYMSVTVTLLGIQSSSVPIVGESGSMFTISNGYIIKDYIEGTGRLKFTTSGDISMTPISMEMKVSLGASTTIESKNFNLPIGGHLTVEAISGTVSIEQNMVLMPGSELIIQNGAHATIGSGIRVIVFDWDDWGEYCGQHNNKYVQLRYVPGGDGIVGREKDAMVVVNGIVDASLGAVYTTSGGANIYSTGAGQVIAVAGTESTTEQIANQNGNQGIEYVPITITPAVLKNADGSDFETASATYNYNNVHGKWVAGEHTVTDTVTVPTCTEKGYTTHVCLCGYTYTDSEVAALGHTEVVDAAVAATCTTTGLTEGKHCSVCNEVLVAQEVVAALGHTEVVDAAVAATCTETGLTEGKHCSVCNTVLVAQEVTPVSHTYNDNCDADCNVCGEFRSAPHNLTEHYEAVKPANCQEQGHDEYWICADCGGYFMSDGMGGYYETNPAWMNYTGDHVRPADAAGCAVVPCELCGEDSYGSEMCVRPEGDPACQNSVCVNCGETIYGEGHSYGYDENYNPLSPFCQPGDCIYCGVHLDYIYECENGSGTPCSVDGECVYGCGKKYPATGEHVFAEGVTACDGGMCYLCWTNIEPQDHNEVVDAAVAATCTETGLTEGKHCSVCNEVLVAQEVTPVLEHTYDDCTCTSCGATTEPAAIVYENGARVKAYLSFADAFEAYTAGQYIVLCANADVNVVLTTDLYVDLKGNKMSGVIDTNGFKVYGMDSTTDEYTCDNMGYFSCVDAEGNAVAPEALLKTTMDMVGAVKRYMTINTETGYTFHRFYLGITHMNLKPSVTGFGYKALFCGDSMVVAQLDQENAFGYTLSLEGGKTVSVYKDQASFVSGKTVTLCLKNYDIEKFGEMKLTANVMLKLADGTVIESVKVSKSMRDMLETLNVMTLDAEKLTAVKAMIEAYPIVKKWDTNNLYN